MTPKFSAFFDDTAAGYDQFLRVQTDIIVGNLAYQSGLARAVARGPITMDALASETGVPRDKLVRLVDYLRAHGVVGLSADGRVTPEAYTARLADPKIGGMWSVYLTYLFAGSQLTAGLRQGKTPFEVQYGKPVFEYFGENAEARGLFGAYMSFMTDLVVKFLHENFRFEPFQVAADIGGSHGDLLLSVLQRYPGTRGVLFDMPGVIEHATPVVRASALADRVELVGGSFFESVPAADLYLLKQILHDWSDAECLKILGSIRKAMRPNARVVVIDYMLADEPQPTQGQATDIAMMVWDTGRERTRSDFGKLFAQAGFKVNRIAENPMGHSVIEGVLA
jgi:hypothetical protein